MIFFDKTLESFLQVKVLKTTVFISVVLMITTMYHRHINGDDCWFGEQAYWLANEGVVKLKSIPLIMNWSNEMLVYHKMLTWMDSIVVFLFGWSVDYMRILNLFLFTASVVMLWKISKNLPKELKWLIVLIMLLGPLSFQKSYEIRPEVPVMFFGIISYYFIQKTNESKKVIFFLMAGFFAGLSFLTHLNGVIFCLAGAMIYVINKNLKGVILFSLAALPICFIYFIPLLDIDTFQQWKYNLMNWPLHSFGQINDQNIVFSLAIKLLSEHKRFFWGDQIIGLSLLFFLSLIFKGRYLWRSHRYLLVYTILLIIFLGLIGSNKSPRYSMMYLPFLVSVIGISIYDIFKGNRKIAKVVMSLSFSLQIIFLGIAVHDLFADNGPYVKRTEIIMSTIPQQTKVLGPWYLIYDQIEDYEIYNYKTFLYLQDLENREIDQLQLMKEASEMGVQYIVLTKEVVSEYDHWFSTLGVEDNSYFQTYSSGEEYVILNRKKP